MADLEVCLGRLAIELLDARNGHLFRRLEALGFHVLGCKQRKLKDPEHLDQETIWDGVGKCIYTPQTVWSHERGVLTVVVKHRCLIEMSHGRAAIYSTFMPLEILEVRFDCAGLQNLVGRGGGPFGDCALVVVPCAFSDMVATFRGRRKGNLVFWWSKVDFS